MREMDGRISQLAAMLGEKKMVDAFCDLFQECSDSLGDDLFSGDPQREKAAREKGEVLGDILQKQISMVKKGQVNR